MSYHSQYDKKRREQILATMVVSNLIVFENPQYLICNKPFDLQIDGYRPLTLEKLILLYRPDMMLRFCHQLDYATSGLIVVAKTKCAAAKANKLFENRSISKHYTALVSGHLNNQEVVTIKIANHPVHKHQMKVSNDAGKTAKTYITPLQLGSWNSRPVTKVLIQPITGRRHQIRLHCLHIGHPIVGDINYARDSKPFRMMLHAQRLHLPFSEPLSPIDVETEDPFDILDSSNPILP